MPWRGNQQVSGGSKAVSPRRRHADTTRPSETHDALVTATQYVKNSDHNRSYTPAWAIGLKRASEAGSSVDDKAHSIEKSPL